MTALFLLFAVTLLTLGVIARELQKLNNKLAHYMAWRGVFTEPNMYKRPPLDDTPRY
jgi:hypothetical protein